MTPKEKAKELFDKFSLGYYHAPNAKECALIVVDEILSLDTSSIGEENYIAHYYLEVKQEIENYGNNN
jgi:hypothetical protein